MSAAIIRVLLLACLAGVGLSDASAADAIHWQPWSRDVFAQAKAQHRFVLLDLEAVWCHWCHVMDTETYADRQVIALVKHRYIAIKVDQDSDPDLSNRYGDYGWPATIVFAADGSEIVKRQGYLAPANMASLLQAIIDDPSPGPSVHAEALVKAGRLSALGAAQRKRLVTSYLQAYDRRYGGWGDLDKYIDADALDYALQRSRGGDASYASMAQQTLRAGQALVDPVWGGVDQYSATTDWKTPHYEKIMSVQANYLRIYSQAYAQWHDTAYRETARAIRGYMDAFLKSPTGAFYVSQDADLNTGTDGSTYYALDDAGRRRLGIPRVDIHVYARENGWAIRALASYHDATGDAAALAEAETAAHHILAERSLEGGGFRHGEQDAAGPYLGDTLAMAEACLDLYRSSGERPWLRQALLSLDFIQQHFRDGSRGGYMTATVAAGARGVLKGDVRLPAENADLVRVASLAYAYSGNASYRRMAEHAMRYLASPGLTDSGRFLPGTLLADAEAGTPPLHITIVGYKDDAAAQALHAAALAYPADYRQIDWWDKREGPLPNPEVSYPELPRPAAFICTRNTCSSPIYAADDIARSVDRLLGSTQP
jgi:uncharacterized protein YyaL (SSP411 family)